MGLFSRYEASKRRWEKIKNDPILHEKFLKGQRKSKKENRESVYEYNNRYRSEMREVAKDLGNCSNCFKENDTPKFRWCFSCRLKHRKNYYKTKKK